MMKTHRSSALKTLATICASALAFGSGRCSSSSSPSVNDQVMVIAVASAVAFTPFSDALKFAGWPLGGTAGVIGALAVARSSAPGSTCSATSLVATSTSAVAASCAKPSALTDQPSGGPGAANVSLSTVTTNACDAESRLSNVASLPAVLVPT